MKSNTTTKGMLFLHSFCLGNEINLVKVKNQPLYQVFEEHKRFYCVEYATEPADTARHYIILFDISVGKLDKQDNF